MLQLYHAPRSRSARVRWLLEELGVPHEIVPVEFSRENLRSPSYRKIHPLGKVPALRDGEVHMIESGAIVEYVLERYGRGRLAPPQDSPDRPRFLQWLHFAEATVLPPLSAIIQNTFLKPEGERIPEVVPGAQGQVAEILGVLDEELAGRDYIAGDEFSAADIMLGYSLTLVKMLGLLSGEFEHASAYLERLEARPAYAKAMS